MVASEDSVGGGEAKGKRARYFGVDAGDRRGGGPGSRSAGVRKSKKRDSSAPAAAPASLVDVTVDDTDALHCGVSFVPLKPPIFQLEQQILQESVSSSCSVHTDQQLENHKLKQQIQPKGVRSENHESMSRGSASAASKREERFEQPNNYLTAVSYLVKKRCPNKYLFFYANALKDESALNTFIALPHYSARKKYLDLLLDKDYVSLPPENRKQWHELHPRRGHDPDDPDDDAPAPKRARAPAPMQQAPA